MAIYRPPKPRWRAAAIGAAAGLLIGGAVGFSIGDPNEPDLDAAVGSIRASLARAAGSLEIAAIEYEEAVEGGEVVADAEYDGALAAVASSKDAYLAARPALVALAPERAAAIDDAYEELIGAMGSTADEQEIHETASELEALLKE